MVELELQDKLQKRQTRTFNMQVEKLSQKGQGLMSNSQKKANEEAFLDLALDLLCLDKPPVRLL